MIKKQFSLIKKYNLKVGDAIFTNGDGLSTNTIFWGIVGYIDDGYINIFQDIREGYMSVLTKKELKKSSFLYSWKIKDSNNCFVEKTTIDYVDYLNLYPFIQNL